MRFMTIWTLPAASLKEKLSRTRDWVALKIANHLPVRIRYWVTISEIGHASANSANVPATPLDEILKGLRTPKDLR